MTPLHCAVRRLAPALATVVTLAAPAGAAAAGWTDAIPQPPAALKEVEALAVRPGGEAWLAMEREKKPAEGDIVVSERRPGGGFSEPRPVGPYELGPFGLRFAHVGGTAPLVVWGDDAGGHVSERAADGTWAPVPGAFGPRYSSPELISLAGGGAMAAWREGDELRVRVRPPGEAFGPYEAVATGLAPVSEFGGRPHVGAAATSDGGVVVAWVDHEWSNGAPLAILRLVSRPPGGEWSEPVVLDTVEAEPATEPDHYSRATFSPVDVRAKPAGGWLVVSAASEDYDADNTPGPGYGEVAVKAYDGTGDDLLGSRTLEARTTPGGGFLLEPVIVDPAGGTLVWWSGPGVDGAGSAYRPDDGAFAAQAPISSAPRRVLVPLGAGRWYRLDFARSERRGAARPLSAFADPVPVIDLPAGEHDSVFAFEGDGAGHALLASGWPAEGKPRLRLYDEAAPSLADVAVPASAAPGERVAFSATASDAWTAATVEWDFGDGTTATGPRAEHAFAAPGRYEVRVSAVDAAGNRATETRTVDVPAPTTTPPPPPDGGGTTGGGERPVTPPPPIVELVDRLAPVIRGLSASGRRARVRLSLSEPGVLDLRLHRVVKGVERDGRCRTSRSARRRGGTDCRRLVRVARSEVRTAAALDRRLAVRALAPGRYRVTVRARDAAGNVAAPVRANLRVARAAR